MKLLLVVLIVAAVTYLVVRYLQDRGLPGPGIRREPKPRRQPPARPVAPDDDEDFLRDLDRKRLDPGDS